MRAIPSSVAARDMRPDSTPADARAIISFTTRGPRASRSSARESPRCLAARVTASSRSTGDVGGSVMESPTVHE